MNPSRYVRDQLLYHLHLKKTYNFLLSIFTEWIVWTTTKSNFGNHRITTTFPISALCFLIRIWENRAVQCFNTCSLSRCRWCGLSGVRNCWLWCWWCCCVGRCCAHGNSRGSNLTRVNCKSVTINGTTNAGYRTIIASTVISRWGFDAGGGCASGRCKIRNEWQYNEHLSGWCASCGQDFVGFHDK